MRPPLQRAQPSTSTFSSSCSNSPFEGYPRITRSFLPAPGGYVDSRHRGRVLSVSDVTFGNRYWRRSGRGSRNACSAAATCAPSPTAAATRLIEPDRTSPIAKTPRQLVSDGLRLLPASVPVSTNPSPSSDTGEPVSQSVFGSAPIKRKRWRMGRRTSSGDGRRRQQTASKMPLPPSRPVTSASVTTSTLAKPAMRSTRYFDMLDPRFGPRTRSQTLAHFPAKKTTAWPAELPPPTRTTSCPAHSFASRGDAQ